MRRLMVMAGVVTAACLGMTAAIFMVAWSFLPMYNVRWINHEQYMWLSTMASVTMSYFGALTVVFGITCGMASILPEKNLDTTT